mmetsp:Transcript_76447/g.216366  ORF Transcript_76447/g.216366 Transcript_76447/m.216366 type:complete len:274 (-) Transcript_76447:638-1459(-)
MHVPPWLSLPKQLLLLPRSGSDPGQPEQLAHDLFFGPGAPQPGLLQPNVEWQALRVLFHELQGEGQGDPQGAPRLPARGLPLPLHGQRHWRRVLLRHLRSGNRLLLGDPLASECPLGDHRESQDACARRPGCQQVRALRARRLRLRRRGRLELGREARGLLLPRLPKRHALHDVVAHAPGVGCAGKHGDSVCQLQVCPRVMQSLYMERPAQRVLLPRAPARGHGRPRQRPADAALVPDPGGGGRRGARARGGRAGGVGGAGGPSLPELPDAPA